MTEARGPGPVSPPDPPLTDGVIRLRPWAMDDAVDVHAATQDPEIPRFMEIPRGQSLEGVERWLATTPAGWELGTGANLAVVAADDGRLLGSISLTRSGDDPEVGEIGYWVAAEARRQGVASRAVALVTEWGFEGFGLYRIEITVHQTNPASQRVAERNGFLREGVLRGYRSHRGTHRVDLVVFGRLKTD